MQDSSLLTVTLYINNVTDASLGVYRLTARNHLRQNSIFITVKKGIKDLHGMIKGVMIINEDDQQHILLKTFCFYKEELI